MSDACEQGSGIHLTAGFSAGGALSAAYSDTLAILLRRFNPRRWLKLSFVCLFLGGGAPSAAFNWSWGTLLHDIRFRITLDHVRRHISAHLGLIVAASVLGLALALALLYFRSVLRFILVDSILKGGDGTLAAAFFDVRPLAHSYFLWLLGCLAAGAALLTVGAMVGMRYLRSLVAVRTGSLGLSIALVLVLASLIVGALIVAVVITLTDDLAVPIMYGQRLTVFPAWQKLTETLRGEPGAFAVYVLVRFGVSMLIGFVLVLLLFPLLLSLFSGSLVAAVLVLLVARAAGYVWAWNPITILFASAGLALLTMVQLVLLSLIGMPGQVFLQDYGMRFIAARFPSPRLEWRA